MEGPKEGMMEERNEGRTRQIQYKPSFSKRGYNLDISYESYAKQMIHIKYQN